MRLITGLGNPGRRYRNTRHNVGFLAIDKIAKDLSIRLRPASRSLMRRSSILGQGEFNGEKIILLEPQTYMNLSGTDIGPLADEKRIAPEDIIVICDDINLELGRIRIRKSGGSGGHNGLKSIIENLGTENFPRLRIGIYTEGFTDKNLTKYVLDEFNKEERILLDKILGVVSEAVKVYLADGIEAAMNKFN